jgi:hypothetical protein
MMPDLGITVYGGAPGKIGGNRILLEWDDGRWLLDFGTWLHEALKPERRLERDGPDVVRALRVLGMRVS